MNTALLSYIKIPKDHLTFQNFLCLDFTLAEKQSFYNLKEYIIAHSFIRIQKLDSGDSLYFTSLDNSKTNSREDYDFFLEATSHISEEDYYEYIVNDILLEDTSCSPVTRREHEQTVGVFCRLSNYDSFMEIQKLYEGNESFELDIVDSYMFEVGKRTDIIYSRLDKVIQ